MDNHSQSWDQLLEELERLRRRVAVLEEEQVNRERNGDDVDLFRPLVEHSLGLMCIHDLDLDGNLLFVNTAAAQALGFRPEDGVGWNLRRFLSPAVESGLGDGWMESIHPADRDRFVEAYRSAMAAGIPFQAEYRLRRADGEYRWMFGSGVPRVETDGAFAGFIGSCVDISPIRQAREALEAAREDLDALVARRTAELEHSYTQLSAAVQHSARLEDERARVHRLDTAAGQAGSPAATLAWGPKNPDRAKTVLLVEARADVRHLLRNILQLDGYRVIDVGDAHSALAVIEPGSEPVHLLLTTIATMGTSGPTVADRLAAVRPGLSILYMSDSGVEITAHQGGFEPAVPLLKMPSTLVDLLGKVREVIDR